MVTMSPRERGMHPELMVVADSVILDELEVSIVAADHLAQAQRTAREHAGRHSMRRLLRIVVGNADFHADCVVSGLPMPARPLSVVSLIHDAQLLNIATGAVLTFAEDVDQASFLAEVRSQLVERGYRCVGIDPVDPGTPAPGDPRPPV
ncbi:hypothetical protein ACMTN4_01725 (plasmid) [Rhodococcus globerulus]|uniref:hypothetical protein n=1 Tax=Rhodococcus globerulus TaxID=33008 RepID=UPI0039E91F28